MKMEPAQLLQAAQEARENAYAPYSNFRVGAALLTGDGHVFPGANIENSSFGATICAERSAFASAVSSGTRSFAALAIVGAPSGKEPDMPCPPCGICRQFMTEFCGPDFPIYLADGNGGVKTYTLDSLLAQAFRGDKLK
jgi:cytidine deaminase